MGLSDVRPTSSARTSTLPVTAERTWQVVAAAGPGPHWYADALPLRFRALVDRVVGGDAPIPPSGGPLLRSGDRAGFWLVRRAADLVLELEAQVRAPGTVRLTTRLEPEREVCRLEQTVTFRPRGVAGAAYLLADLPARELTIELVHRRLVADVLRAESP